MRDLSALTASTGCEFAMFTKEWKRIIIRGNESMVNIDVEKQINNTKMGIDGVGTLILVQILIV